MNQTYYVIEKLEQISTGVAWVEVQYTRAYNHDDDDWSLDEKYPEFKQDFKDKKARVVRVERQVI